jgi:hypothetical protein
MYFVVNPTTQHVWSKIEGTLRLLGRIAGYKSLCIQTFLGSANTVQILLVSWNTKLPLLVFVAALSI